MYFGALHYTVWLALIIAMHLIKRSNLDFSFGEGKKESYLYGSQKVNHRERNVWDPREKRSSLQELLGMLNSTRHAQSPKDFGNWLLEHLKVQVNIKNAYLKITSTVLSQERWKLCHSWECLVLTKNCS